MVKQIASSEAQPDDASAADDTLRDVLGDRLFNDYANLVETDRKFSQLDLDNDGFLGKVELSDPSNPHSRAQDILSNFDIIQNAHDDEYGVENDGITRDDLASSFAANAANRISDGKVHKIENGVDIWSIGKKGQELDFIEIYDKSRDTHLTWHPFSMEVHNSEFDVPGYSDDWASMQEQLADLQERAGDLSRSHALGIAADAYENLVDGGGAAGAFAEIDSNSNGFLSQEELVEFVQSSESGDKSTAAARMSLFYDEIQEASNDEMGDENDGITQADLEQDLINRAFAADIETRIKRGLSAGFSGGQTQNDHWSKVFDETSGVSVHKDSDSQTITIEDQRRGLTTEIQFSRGTFLDNFQVKVSKEGQE